LRAAARLPILEGVLLVIELVMMFKAYGPDRE